MFGYKNVKIIEIYVYVFVEVKEWVVNKFELY